MENTEALKLINQGFEWEANYQKVIFQIICRGLSVDESIQRAKSLEHFKSLYESIPRNNLVERYTFMKKAKFRILEITEEDLNKGLINEGQYLSGCNTLRRIYT
jgi:hypothetical protein